MYSGEYNNDFSSDYQPAMSGEFSYRRRRSPGMVAFWVSLLVSTVVVIVSHTLVIPFLQQSQQTVVVPKLSGLRISQATGIVSSLGLRLERMARQADKRPAGTILSHMPAPGQRVKSGTSVRVILSLGQGQPAPARRPAVANANQASDTADNPQGASDNQPPPNNRSAARRAPVQPKKGMQGGWVRVPRLTNRSLAKAKRMIRRAGLRLRHISFGADEDKSPHWVLGQKPRPYRKVRRGSPVDLTINRDDL